MFFRLTAGFAEAIRLRIAGIARDRIHLSSNLVGDSCWVKRKKRRKAERAVKVIINRRRAVYTIGLGASFFRPSRQCSLLYLEISR